MFLGRSFSTIRTRRWASTNGSGLKRIVLTRPHITVAVPMPAESVKTATVVKPRFLVSERTAYLVSRHAASSHLALISMEYFYNSSGNDAPPEGADSQSDVERHFECHLKWKNRQKPANGRKRRRGLEDAKSLQCENFIAADRPRGGAQA